jgi:hypothetical protein
MRRFIAAVLLGISAPALAATSGTETGTIAVISGSTVTVKLRTGATATVDAAPGAGSRSQCGALCRRADHRPRLSRCVRRFARRCHYPCQTSVNPVADRYRRPGNGNAMKFGRGDQGRIGPADIMALRSFNRSGDRKPRRGCGRPSSMAPMRLARSRNEATQSALRPSRRAVAFSGTVRC